MILAEILENNKIVISERKNTDAVSESVLFETVAFKFPESWKSYAKTAVFTADSQTVNVLLSAESDLCISENECYIPHEVLKGDSFYLSAFGVKGDSIATSTKAEIEILESGYALGEAPEEPTPTVYQQLIDLTEAVKMIAESVRSDADNGVFKGDTGEKGDKGEQGEKGDKGEQGEKGEPGNIMNIDQTYNPASENAQSGKAVAEAVYDVDLTKHEVEINFDGGDASADIEPFVIDKEISDVSTNPIANKIIKEYVDSTEDMLKQELSLEISKVSEKHDNDITDVNGKINNITDYIIEQGTSGDWIYRKWNSGIAECWGTTSGTYDIKGEWGNIYYSTAQSVIADYPFTFVSKPVCTYSAETGTDYSVIPMAIGPKGTTTRTPAIQFCRATPVSELEIEINWYVLGRWKE